MKKILLLFGILIISLSCESDETNSDDSQMFTRNIELKSMMKAQVGKIDNKGIIHLTATDASIRQQAQMFLRKSDENANLTEYHVESIDDKEYLRWSGDNGRVATVALIINPQNGDVSLGETVCESNACSDGGGCVPNGLYCTSCIPNPALPNYKGDCKRTTTGGQDPSIDP